MEPPFDRAALESLYVRLEKPLYNVVYRWVWDPTVAEDIVHDTFVRLWSARRQVVTATVEPLVYRIALNLVRNRRRWHRLRTFLGLDGLRAGAPPADEALADHHRADRVRAAIDALPDKLRTVMVLTAYSGLSYAEIAALTGTPEGTVGSRRNRAIALLRAAVGGEDG
ncbi:MAG: sigma-70 family RNA polymerase sigma factor [Myxococcota bacterium]